MGEGKVMNCRVNLRGKLEERGGQDIMRRHNEGEIQRVGKEDRSRERFKKKYVTEKWKENIERGMKVKTWMKKRKCTVLLQSVITLNPVIDGPIIHST